MGSALASVQPLFLKRGLGDADPAYTRADPGIPSLATPTVIYGYGVGFTNGFHGALEIYHDATTEAFVGFGMTPYTPCCQSAISFKKFGNVLDLAGFYYSCLQCGKRVRSKSEKRTYLQLQLEFFPEYFRVILDSISRRPSLETWLQELYGFGELQAVMAAGEIKLELEDVANYPAGELAQRFSLFNF